MQYCKAGRTFCVSKAGLTSFKLNVYLIEMKKGMYLKEIKYPKFTVGFTRAIQV